MFYRYPVSFIDLGQCVHVINIDYEFNRRKWLNPQPTLHAKST